jgi:hypothetical protein
VTRKIKWTGQSNAAVREVDKIIGRGMIGGEAIAQEMRNRLIQVVVENKDKVPGSVLLEMSRELLHEFDGVMADAISDTEMAAWIEGIQQVAKRAPLELVDHLGELYPIVPTKPPGGVAPPRKKKHHDDHEPLIIFPRLEESYENLIERSVVTRPQFDMFDDWMKKKAFTVAYQNSEEAIEAIRDDLVTTLEAGATIDDFRDRIDESLGAGSIGEAHLETIFRTNTQSAFANGQEAIGNNPIIRSVFPFASYHPIHDGRVRDNHLELENLGLEDGNIYWADDPMWKIFTPPWGYNCRCGKSFLTVAHAAKFGLKIAQDWERTGIAPVDHQSRLPFIPFRPEGEFIGPGVAA